MQYRHWTISVKDPAGNNDGLHRRKCTRFPFEAYPRLRLRVCCFRCTTEDARRFEYHSPVDNSGTTNYREESLPLLPGLYVAHLTRKLFFGSGVDDRWPLANNGNALGRAGLLETRYTIVLVSINSAFLPAQPSLLVCISVGSMLESRNGCSFATACTILSRLARKESYNEPAAC